MSKLIKNLKDFIRDSRFFLTNSLIRVLPSLDILDKAILIIAPHPDDETLGCGGLICRLCGKGNPPHIAILTHGEASHRGCCSIDSNELGINRIRLAQNANSILGLSLENIRIFNYADGFVPQHDECGDLFRYIQSIKPEIILIPHWGEDWPDHINVKSMISEGRDRNFEVYEYCVWTWYYLMWAGNNGFSKLQWNKAKVLKLNKNERTRKGLSIDEYLAPVAKCGRPYSGVLPSQLVQAGKSGVELYFKLSL